jgi:uncharacterized protein (TIGR03083 family)
MYDLVSSLSEDDWAQPTDCPAWDVRAMTGHVLGSMEGFSSFGSFVHIMRAASKAAGDGPLVDAMTAVQVRERAGLDRVELLERLRVAGPKASRWRSKVPNPFRRAPLKQEVNGVTETWRMGYLLDIILTRDTWMHRVDITRATGRELILTADHDGRIVADAVAEWARRHGRPFTLTLTGAAGGTFVSGSGGDELTVDAVELCRTFSGRGTGRGLLATEVPF